MGVVWFGTLIELNSFSRFRLNDANPREEFGLNVPKHGKEVSNRLLQRGNKPKRENKSI